MPQAPVADQRRLLDVQSLDTHLTQLRHKRNTLEVLATITELQSRLEDTATALAHSRTRASDLTRELTKAEDDVTQVTTRLTRNQQRLDTGSVSAKDAQALMHEITSLTARQAELEDVQIDVMERLEAHQEALGTVENAHAQLVSALADAEQDRDAQFAAIDQEIAQITARRQDAVAGIDDALLALYEKIRTSRGGVGAALLEGRQCGGCRLDLNAGDLDAIRSASAESVVRCEECGRILVRD